MLRKGSILIFLAGLIVLHAMTANAQSTSPSPTSLFPKADDKFDPGGSVQDMLKKLEIEREKKDFQEMQDRAKQAFDLSNELEDSVAANERFSDKERSKLDELEKLVKRVRRDLGGSDDDDDTTADKDKDEPVVKTDSFADAVKALQTVTGKMYEEVQKTTRFTVSGAAIKTSNAVLRITRLLKVFR